MLVSFHIISAEQHTLQYVFCATGRINYFILFSAGNCNFFQLTSDFLKLIYIL